jgi:CubicO group peptidase (beta-lactamase class C family)
MSQGRKAWAAVTVMVWLAAAAPAQAPSYPINPYTGGPIFWPPHNPYTRAGVGLAPVHDPYLESQPGPRADNPYRGILRPEYHFHTDRPGSRAENRMPPGSWQRHMPVTGKVGPGLEFLDEAMLNILEKYHIPGGALAVARKGKLVVARGYGWASVQTGDPVRPDTLFALASLSKCFTAATVLKLADEGKLGLDDRAFRLFADLRPPPDILVDPLIDTITIRELLNHSAGWDRNVGGDPASFSYRVARTLRVPLPIRPDDLIRYMMTVPLDYDPGTREVYSNFGYVVLGQVIERIAQRPYAEAVRSLTLRPMGIRRAYLPGLDLDYLPGQAWRYKQGTDLALPPRAVPPVADAAGSWIASAVDLARFLSTLDGSMGKPFLSQEMMRQMLTPPPPPLTRRPGGTWFGLGWDVVRRTPQGTSYWKDGLLPGSRTFMGHLANGVDWVLLFNSGEAMTVNEVAGELDPRRDLEQHMNRAHDWPDVDYFKDYP